MSSIGRSQSVSLYIYTSQQALQDIERVIFTLAYVALSCQFLFAKDFAAKPR